MSHYKPYPAYKDSGIEWIGEVPEHWKVVSLLHLFNIKAGGDLKKDFYSEEKTEEYSYPIYTNSIKSNEAYGFTSKPFFKANTITVTGRGEIGYAIYRDHEYDAIIRLLVLTPKNNKPCKYFAYCINSILVFFGGNTAVSQLSTEQISPYKIFCPPFPEQQSIVSFLDRQTAHIDALITKKTRFIELLKEKRQALITHAVTKGLDPNVKMKDSGVEWIGEVPEHWEVTRIKWLTKLRIDRRNDSPEGYHYIGLEDIEPETGKLKPTENNSRQSEESNVAVFFCGDVLYGKLRPYLKKAIISEQEGICSTEFLIIRPVSVSPRWLQHWLLTSEVTQQIEAGCFGAKMPRTDWEHVSSIFMPIPDSTEQATIISALDQQTARIDLIIEKTQRSIDLLRERRSALITAAVTGKIDIRGSL